MPQLPEGVDTLLSIVFGAIIGAVLCSAFLHSI